jgi:amino-acid N-acetyltransferase
MQRIELLRVNPPAANVVEAAPPDLPEILSLLDAAGLPVADLTADSQVEFLIARRAQRLVGVVGLERFGEVGLLRSLAVDAEHQRQGMGLALTRALEAHAASMGISSLVLLTETASGFFLRHGYEAIPRAGAPRAVQASTEFRQLCPDSAVCMTKRL